MNKIIGKCKKCKIPLSTTDLIEEGAVSLFDSDNHLSGMDGGKNILRCPKCFKTQESDISIDKYKNRTEYLTKTEVDAKIEALQTHRKFFRRENEINR